MLRSTMVGFRTDAFRRVSASVVTREGTFAAFRSRSGRATIALCRQGPGCGVSRCETHRPADHLQPHLLELGLIPDVKGVPEAVIEDAAFAVVTCPDNGEIAVVPMDAFSRK